jgi:hypothetical protein
MVDAKDIPLPLWLVVLLFTCRWWTLSSKRHLRLYFPVGTEVAFPFP